MKNYRSTIIGFAILIVLLSAGAAQSLSGSSTVYSDDIVDSTIITADLKNGAVNGSKILDDSVTGADIKESKLNLAGNCSDGAIKGNVFVQGADAGSNMPNEDNSEAWGTYKYNCAGGKVFIRRFDAGYYLIYFQDNAHRGAVATVEIDGDAVTATVSNGFPGQFYVKTLDSSGNRADANFALVVW